MADAERGGGSGAAGAEFMEDVYRRNRLRHSNAWHSGAQRRGDPISADAVDFEYFPAAGGARDHAHAALGDAQTLRDELDQRMIRGVCRPAAPLYES